MALLSIIHTIVNVAAFATLATWATVRLGDWWHKWGKP